VKPRETASIVFATRDSSRVHQDQRQLVQEVAAGGLPAPPSRYVLREETRPTKSGVAPAPELMTDFPTVDLERLAEPGDVEEIAKLRSALESWGLFAVRARIHAYGWFN
jgi:hypothetical protein